MSYAEDISELNFRVKECKIRSFLQRGFCFSPCRFWVGFFCLWVCLVLVFFFSFLVTDIFQVWGKSWRVRWIPLLAGTCSLWRGQQCLFLLFTHLSFLKCWDFYRVLEKNLKIERSLIRKLEKIRCNKEQIFTSIMM